MVRDVAKSDPTPKAGASGASEQPAVPDAGGEGTAPTGIPHEAIARRAYEIHVSDNAGSDLDNWLRAERELLEST